MGREFVRSAGVLPRLAAALFLFVATLQSRSATCGTVAAADLPGKTVTFNITAGAAPFPTSGNYRIQFAAAGNGFTVLDAIGGPAGGTDTAGTWSFGEHLGIPTVVTLTFSPSATVERIALLPDCTYERYKDGLVANQSGNYAGLTAGGAPVITQQPQSVVVTIGTAVTFTAAATGAPAPTFQWQRDNVDLPGETNPTISIASADYNTYGAYRVIVRNAGGSETSGVANLSIMERLPGTILLPVGGRLSLSANVSGPDPVVSYQWIKDNAPVAGFTSVSFNKSNVGETDSGAYRVAVTTGGATGSTSTANVSVIPTTVAGYRGKSFGRLVESADAQLLYSANFSEYPIVKLNNNVVTFLGVVSPGSNPRGVFTYSVADGLTKRVDTATAIPNGTGNFAFFHGVTPVSNGSLYFLGQGSGGQAGVYQLNNGAVTRLFDTTTTIPTRAVTFANFDNLYDSGGQIWFVGGRLGAGAFRGVYRSSGALTPLVDFDSVAPPGPGKYVSFGAMSVEGTSAAFIASEGVTFKVGVYASINGSAVQRVANSDTPAPGGGTIGNPGEPRVNSGKVTFRASNGSAHHLLHGDAASVQTVVKTGDILPARNIPITDFYTSPTAGLAAEPDGFYFTANSGLYNGVYRYRNGSIERVIDTVDAINGNPLRVVRLVAAQGDEVVVYVQFYNGQAGLWGTIAGGAAPVAPTITQGPVSRSVEVGQSVTFTVSATGDAPLTYVWTKNGNEVVGGNSPTLTLDNVQTGSAGDYRVTVSNGGGSQTSAPATLTVTTPPPAPPVITQNPQSRSVLAGASVTFTVQASGVGPFTYQWHKNGGPITGATAAEYTINPVALGDAGDYHVRVFNAGGSVPSAAATLTVQPPPPPALQIVSGPQNQTVTIGGSALFSVQATGGVAAITYQWTRDGAPIAGATSATLVISNAQTANAGAYRVVVTSGAETLTSNPATLTVNPPSARSVRVTDVHISGGLLEALVRVTADGSENSIAFRLSYDASRLGTPLVTLQLGLGVPAFEGNRAAGGVAGPSMTIDTTVAGEIGVTVTVPAGQTLPAGDSPLVALSFPAAAGTTATQGQLAFTAAPSGATTTGAPLTAQGIVVPIAAPGVFPAAPSDQNGLFTQTLTISNPSGAVYPGVRIFVNDLPADTGANRIRVANAHGSVNGVPYIDIGPVAAGASAAVAVEFYVQNRVTVPAPRYETVIQAPLVLEFSSFSVEAANATRVVDGQFFAEFSTQAGRAYYVQYNSDVNATTGWKTSLPGMIGTGSRMQWIDTGPPRTDSPPSANPMRFYRVIVLP